MRALNPSLSLHSIWAAVLLSGWLSAAWATDWNAINKAVDGQNWSAAAPLIQAGLQDHPRDARLRLLQGLVQGKLGELTQAKATLLQLAADHPELSEAHNNLGIVLALSGDWRAALHAFERAVLANPQHEAAQQNLRKAQAHFDGQSEGALPTASK